MLRVVSVALFWEVSVPVIWAYAVPAAGRTLLPAAKVAAPASVVPD